MVGPKSGVNMVTQFKSDYSIAKLSLPLVVLLACGIRMDYFQQIIIKLSRPM
jgi:hypothetical protein